MMLPEIDHAALDDATDRELLEYIAHMLGRLEPLLSLLENPPPMMAAMLPNLNGSD